MKYRIDSKAYFAREEENGTMSLIVNATNRILFLNRTGRRLLTRCDEWVDLAEFVNGLHISGAPFETVCRDFEKLLYELESYGLAELADRPEETYTGCRVADCRDGKLVSDFLLANADRGFSCAISVNPAYNALAGVYARIQNGSEQYLISERDGQVLALVAMARPNRVIGVSAAVINSAVFLEGMLREACKEQLQTLLAYGETVYAGECGKLRYVYMNERQNGLRETLQTLGFTQSALLKNEVYGGRDMILYDRFIG